MDGAPEEDCTLDILAAEWIFEDGLKTLPIFCDEHSCSVGRQTSVSLETGLQSGGGVLPKEDHMRLLRRRFLLKTGLQKRAFHASLCTGARII
jgi:hypothetical protein